MKWKVLIIAFVLLSGITASIPVQAQETEPPLLISLENFEIYAPARVVISFSYTKNVTQDVSTLGNSLYQLVTSPIEAEFKTETPDSYTIRLGIKYDIQVNQTVTIAIFDGDRPTKGISLPLNTEGFSIELKLSVVAQPDFPTPEEISDLMWTRWANELNDFEIKQDNLVNELAGFLVSSGAFAVIAFGIALACLIAVIYLQKRQTSHERRMR